MQTSMVVLSREEFWMFVLGNFTAMIAIGIIGNAIHLKILVNLYQLAILVPMIALHARRMHDVNKSGRFQLIPIYNLILALTKGDHGHNRFGDVPHEPKAM